MADTQINTHNTINRRFAESVAKYGDRPALSAKVGGSKTWTTLTFGEVGAKVRRFSLGLRSLGVQKGDRVALLAEDRLEWAVADQGILASGCVTVPIYPTLPPSQVAHILNDCGARAIIVSDAKQLQKVIQARSDCPNLTIFIAMEESSAKGDVLSFEAAMREGDAYQTDESYEARRDSVHPDDLMSLVYTSGTTGNPKGAMLTHANMSAALDGAQKAFPFYPPTEVFLSLLPLCHVFERVTYCLALTLGAQTYYKESYLRLMENMSDAKPTIMQCVPRVFESIYERIMDTAAKAPPKQQKLFHWALDVGAKAAERRNWGKSVGPILGIQFAIADKLVLSKIRARFGGRLKFMVSGGAPLDPRVARFFQGVGLPILEGWGLTETTAATTVNPYQRAHIGTVGQSLFGAEIKTASDGELLVRGTHVMRGYWNNPEATAEAIDSEGWFHTGDIGEIDKNGYVKITDRKKDILVLANGKKVAPQPIETLLKHSPYVTEVVLLGDKQDSISALVVPNFDKLKAWAKEQGKDVKDNATLVADIDARRFVKKEMDKVSGELADFEKIKKIALLDHVFTEEAGELTPTQKIKRRTVAEKYGSLLEKEEK